MVLPAGLYLGQNVARPLKGNTRTNLTLIAGATSQYLGDLFLTDVAEMARNLAVLCSPELTERALETLLGCRTVPICHP
jgi:hypothetical protein